MHIWRNRRTLSLWSEFMCWNSYIWNSGHGDGIWEVIRSWGWRPHEWDCYCSVAQLFLTLCDPMDCSTPGFPVPHHLLESAQTHVHWAGDAIQPSHPLPLPSPAAPSLLPVSGSFPVSRLFTSGGQDIGASASVLPVNTQGWFPLGWTGLISLLSKGLRVCSSTTVWKHQFFSAQPFLLSSSHIHIWQLEIL